VIGAAFQLIGRATNLNPPSLIGLFLCSCKRAASAAAFAAITASASAVSVVDYNETIVERALEQDSV
jgi:hypothetical protein